MAVPRRRFAVGRVSLRRVQKEGVAFFMQEQKKKEREEEA